MNRHSTISPIPTTRPDRPCDFYAQPGHPEIIGFPESEMAELEKASDRGYLMIDREDPFHAGLCAAYRSWCVSRARPCIEVRRRGAEVTVTLDMTPSREHLVQDSMVRCTEWLLENQFQPDQFEVHSDEVVVRRVPLHLARLLAGRIRDKEPFGENESLEYSPNPPRCPRWLRELRRVNASEEQLYEAAEAREERERAREAALDAEDVERVRQLPDLGKEV
ncbi:hypothetical protein ElP_42820 [Tautonia plasticadhaerens]|uniref:Uncharacterized protein n=2 Tax=Tautonia plasticadhaerens TaxID=2527974 RepID=A0A518H695_9BACT|nr:hypothetical protein ElP_42820 [Tautonia plasticadhaerens]